MREVPVGRSGPDGKPSDAAEVELKGSGKRKRIACTRPILQM